MVMKKITEVLNKLPHVHKWQMPMVADSSNEIWVDVNTHLGNGDGWHIVGFHYTLENVDPTIPCNWLAAASAEVWTLQVHRNTDNETFLNHNDDDLLLDDKREYYALTSGIILMDRTFRVPVNTVTTKPKLRVMFRSLDDMAQVSASTVQMVGAFEYHKLNGPKNAGYTKHGLMKEL